MHDYNSLLKIAIEAALAAGHEILNVYKDIIEVELKEDKSPLTIADKKSHEQIIEHLSATGLSVMSEEGRSIPYDERKNWKHFWMVDPLDGTKEFIKKNGEFTVNIALIENKKAVMGVIYVPVSDTLFFGANWLPSRMTPNASLFPEDRKINSIAFEKLIATSFELPLPQKERPYTVVASRSHLTPDTETFVEGLRQLHGELAFISKGSSLKICLVAEGIADVYPRLAPTMEWDTAAGQAIAENAGCKMIDYGTGQNVSYNKENLLNPQFVVSRH